MQAETPRITSVRISARPTSIGDPLPKVTAVLDDGEVVELFTYFPDEIEFKPIDFIGCTVEEARRLKFVKDRRFLRGTESDFSI